MMKIKVAGLLAILLLVALSINTAVMSWQSTKMARENTAQMEKLLKQFVTKEIQVVDLVNSANSDKEFVKGLSQQNLLLWSILIQRGHEETNYSTIKEFRTKAGGIIPISYTFKDTRGNFVKVIMGTRIRDNGLTAVKPKFVFYIYNPGGWTARMDVADRSVPGEMLVENQWKNDFVINWENWRNFTLDDARRSVGMSN